MVVIRCGALGAYGMRSGEKGLWVEAYWKDKTEGHVADVLLENEPRTHVVDVTGAGNAFLGGLSAGLHLSQGDVY